MTQEDEICYWSKHKDGTKVWGKMKSGKWVILDQLFWTGFSGYIVDDEWAELRKAQEDGEQLQFTNGVDEWIDSELTLSYIRKQHSNEVQKWRVKPKKPSYEWQWHCRDSENHFRLTEKHYKTQEEAFNELSACTNAEIERCFRYLPSVREVK